MMNNKHVKQNDPISKLIFRPYLIRLESKSRTVRSVGFTEASSTHLQSSQGY